VNEPKTLLLAETGVVQLPDGSSAVNVGPIVRALTFLTEGRGEDRGTDEQGRPLPDLMSLAFDVIESIILGGRKAEYFRRVKLELDNDGEGFSRSLGLAKRARRVQARELPTALDEAAMQLSGMLSELGTRPVAEERQQQLTQSLEAFRAFGAERWVSATAQLLSALSALGALEVNEAKDANDVTERKARRAKARRKRKAPSTAKPGKPSAARTKAPRALTATKTSRKPRKAAARAAKPPKATATKRKKR
jgi:hypothetical protein